MSKRTKRLSMVGMMEDLLTAVSVEKKLLQPHLRQAGSDFYVGDPVWMTHPEQAWIPANITAITNDTHISVRAEQKKFDRGEQNAEFHTAEAEATLAKNLESSSGNKKSKQIIYILPRDNRMQHPKGIENMDNMVHLHEGAVLDNLRVRFSQDLIYTSTGPILIAMNPFKRLPIYSKELMLATHSKLSASQSPCEPHVFTTVGQSYIAMKENQENQSMVICGESGAGKTETTKLMLRYLSKTASRVSGGGEIEEQILESNPLMEAFGNAKTLRNDNSSRFGKYVRVQFNGKYEIIGAQITNYLLEKSRIVHQPNDERNYHIFYQLFKGCNETLRSRLGLKNDIYAFNYLNQSGCVDVDSIDDINGEELSFSETQQAMLSMKIVGEELDFVYSVLGGILHLGNVEFEDDETAEKSIVTESSMSAIALAAGLFQVPSDQLSLVLRQRVRRVGGQPIASPLTATEASQTRDALAKSIYDKLFTWLVQRINSTIAQGKSETFIGILDIYGFEDLDPNGFEQLFINYANEKLQALFNEHIFHMEEDEYKKENIIFDPQEFPDNQACLDLIDKPPRGILMLINEQCMRGDVGSDSALASKLHRTHGAPIGKKEQKQHSHYEVAGPSTKWRGTDANFVIRHYAGRIMYTTDGFVRKNRDTLLDTIEACMYSSSLSEFSKLFASSTGAKTLGVQNKTASSKPPGGGATTSSMNRHNGGPKHHSGGSVRRSQRGGRGKIRGTAISVTVGKRFKDQLSSLIRTMQATAPRFVRCIKSNTYKKALMFEAPNVLRQLKYAGKSYRYMYIK
jgi:myosin-5